MASKWVKFWIKAYDDECRKTKTANKPFGVRLARRVGVEEELFSKSLPTGVRDFVRGMLNERWAEISVVAKNMEFHESARRAYAVVFENNITQAYKNVSVVDMFARFETTAGSWNGNVLERFAAEFNDHSAKKRTYIPDGDAQQGRKYLTHMDTHYIDNFEDALLIMKNHYFWGVATKKTADGTLQAVAAMESRLDKLVGESLSSRENISISEDEFVNVVIPVVRITEAWGSRGERVAPEVNKRAMKVLAEMEHGSFEFADCCCDCKGAVDWHQAVQTQQVTPGATVGTAITHQTQMVASQTPKELPRKRRIENGAKIRKISSTPGKLVVIELVGM